jgi:DnaJ-domain-containing protein 1
MASTLSTAEPNMSDRRLVREHHPDRHIASGTPPEFIRVAEARMATINAAYAALTKGAGVAP